MAKTLVEEITCPNCGKSTTDGESTFEVYQKFRAGARFRQRPSGSTLFQINPHVLERYGQLSEILCNQCDFYFTTTDRFGEVGVKDGYEEDNSEDDW